MGGLREPISESLRQRIKDYVREYGVDALADSVSVTPQTVYRWGNGKISSADSVTLQKVARQITQYPSSQGGYHEISDHAAPDLKRTDHEVRPPELLEVYEIPVLGTAQAASDEELITASDWLSAMDRAETIQLADVPPNTVCLQVEGDSMLPDYPPGTKLFCLPDRFPERGDTVVCMLASGQLVCKLYHRKNNVITLSSRNPEGATYSWNVKEGPGCHWMWPVISVMVDLRKQRWHRNIHPVD